MVFKMTLKLASKKRIGNMELIKTSLLLKYYLQMFIIHRAVLDTILLTVELKKRFMSMEVFHVQVI